MSWCFRLENDDMNDDQASLFAEHKPVKTKNCERCGKNHYDLSRPTVPTCSFKPYGGDVTKRQEAWDRFQKYAYQWY